MNGFGKSGKWTFNKILPTPKYDENQKEYYTHIASNGTALSIPNILPDEERTANIIEALGYYGQKYLTPAFNEVALVSKYSRDDESAEYLGIIFVREIVSFPVSGV